MSSALSPMFHCHLGKEGTKPGRISSGLSSAPSQACLCWETCSHSPNLEAPVLTRGGEEIRVVVVSLMQRVMRVRSQEGGCGHEGVAIV